MKAALTDNTMQMLFEVAHYSNVEAVTFDQLAEEVMELHLSLRGKHPDTPAMEWLEVATIAMNAFGLLPEIEQQRALAHWQERHG